MPVARAVRKASRAARWWVRCPKANQLRQAACIPIIASYCWQILTTSINLLKE